MYVPDCREGWVVYLRDGVYDGWNPIDEKHEEWCDCLVSIDNVLDYIKGETEDIVVHPGGSLVW
jgi:hypothetical protein